MRAKRIERNIDAALLEIARNILPEIRKLQRRAGVIGKPLPLFIAVIAKIQHQPANRICRVDAIVEQIVPGAIAITR